MKPFENYIQYLKRLQSNYEVGTGQHNVLGIAINEAEEALRQFAVSWRSEQLIDFFKHININENLNYQENGIKMYVDDYIKSINCH